MQQGLGSLPWTWPKEEQAIDLIHKGIYAFVTGAIADTLIEGPKTTPDVRKGWTVGGKANFLTIISPADAHGRLHLFS